jgi:tRNA modification GTPase
MASFSDTIAALSTPPGTGGLAVVRVSGTRAIEIVAGLFSPKRAMRALTEMATHRVAFGEIHDGQGEKIDDALVSLFRAPHSFTGENTVEISCHGSVYIQQKILQLLVAGGARMATAGEFTQRAFLNGKMDLAQAEAVADLIASENAAAHRVAMQQLRGGFSAELQALRAQLLDFASLIELELDFSEEEVAFADRAQLNTLLQQLQTVVGRLLQSFALGNAIKKGVPVAIVGATNVGKSTLLNTLLGEERAIVSDLPGTTRDSIEDTLSLEGILFRFIDTAGLRNTSESIEQLGIERTFDKIRHASVVLFVVDATRPETCAPLDDIRARMNDAQHLIIVVNKTDMARCEVLCTPAPIPISAKNRQGLEALTKALLRSLHRAPLAANETIVTRLRHYEALQGAQKALTRVAQGLSDGISSDLIAQDIREALYHIASITGEIATEDILENIFGKFCIGK